jgi:hypothetical protein
LRRLRECSRRIFILRALQQSARRRDFLRSGSFRQNPTFVMAGHSHPKDGVASLAYVPAIHAFHCRQARRGCPAQAGHDAERAIKTWHRFRVRISDSHFKQPAR